MTKARKTKMRICCGKCRHEGIVKVLAGALLPRMRCTNCGHRGEVANAPGSIHEKTGLGPSMRGWAAERRPANATLH